MSAEKSNTALLLARLWLETKKMWNGDEERARAYLERANVLLDGRTPLDVASTSPAGLAYVIDTMRRATAGVAA